MRVLFFCEPCTLTHVLRPLAYARLLPRDRFECHVACAYDPARHGPPGESWPFHPVGGCVTNSEFTAALARGTLPYEQRVLGRYVDEDLRILDEVRPDVVVGDFRLSLGISAPLRRVPYVALVNAVWSPFAQRAFPVPELPVVRALGLPLASALFPLFRPLVFARLARAFNSERRARGLSPFGDLLEVYTWGDFTIYPDLPQLFPARALPSTHRFVGPLKVGPHAALPAWWDRVPRDRAWVYVAMGSSGRAGALPSILEALATLDVEVLVATSERGAAPARSNVWVSDWLPLDPVLARARVAIGNGGTGGVYYAFAHGVPVLSVPANMDQHMVAEAVACAGAGLFVRSDRAQPSHIRDAVLRLLEQATFGERARALAAAMDESDVAGAFQRVLREAQ